MAIDDPSKQVELARATARDILANGYAVLCKGMDSHRIARQFGSGRNAVHSRLRQLGRDQNNDAIIANLADVFLDPARTGETERLAQSVMERFTGSEDPDAIASIRALCVAFFEIVDDKHVTDIQIFLWSGRSNDEIAESLRGIYAHIDSLVEGIVTQLLDQWSRVMRPPFTTADLASAVGSLIDGLIIRQRVDLVEARSELFGNLVLALVPTMTQPADAPTTEFVDFLTGQLGSRSSQDLLSTAELRTRAVQLIIQWVRAGWPRSSITTEALAAGVDFPVDLFEAALGSPELLVATEIRQYAEMVVLRRPGPDDYAAALVSLATLHRELLSHFLSSAIEPHPNPTVLEAVDLLASPLDELAPPSAGRSSTGAAQRCKLLVMAALDGAGAEELAGQIAAWA
ncbi:MAG: hypothetical protein ABI239_10320 [Aquihabitans sp.]